MRDEDRERLAKAWYKNLAANGLSHMISCTHPEWIYRNTENGIVKVCIKCEQPIKELKNIGETTLLIQKGDPVKITPDALLPEKPSEQKR